MDGWYPVSVESFYFYAKLTKRGTEIVFSPYNFQRG
jgi:hypothetical protein